VVPLLAASFGALHAQTVRAMGATYAQFVTLRALVADSVEVGTTSGEGLLRRGGDGAIVRCVTGEQYCRYLRSGNTISTAPFIQDLTLSAWGFGRGLRAYVQLRGRAGIGEDRDFWPHADDAFDVLVAYMELERARFRLRAGRQWKVSGLGYYNWDGASMLVRVTPRLQLEVYGGWSLARGLNEPVSGESLQAIEAFAPDVRALLIGAQSTWRPSPLFTISALYQREIRDDRIALYSERIALDGSMRQGRMRLEGSLEVDAALHDVNDARLRAGVALPHNLGADLFFRRYLPYFDLWTIWGAFDPIGFTEFGTTVAWRPVGHPLALSLDLARRSYPEAEAATTFGSAESTGWRFGGTVAFRPDTVWSAQLHYHTDAGFGAGRNDLSAFLRRELASGRFVSVRALLFERAYEFRVSNGRVLGVGLDAGARLGPRVHAEGGAAVYRHVGGDADPGLDWSQVRASFRLGWTVGPEPGMPGRPGSVR
jgi:hypothetical protein